MRMSTTTEHAKQSDEIVRRMPAVILRLPGWQRDLLTAAAQRKGVSQRVLLQAAIAPIIREEQRLQDLELEAEAVRVTKHAAYGVGTTP